MEEEEKVIQKRKLEWGAKTDDGSIWSRKELDASGTGCSMLHSAEDDTGPVTRSTKNGWEGAINCPKVLGSPVRRWGDYTSEAVHWFTIRRSNR